MKHETKRSLIGLGFLFYSSALGSFTQVTLHFYGVPAFHPLQVLAFLVCLGMIACVGRAMGLEP